jgi:exodeoxyribonuclease-3
MQETKVVNNEYPDFPSYSGSCVANGQKSYNGVSAHCIKPPSDVIVSPWQHGEKRVLAFTYNNIRFINLYVPMGGKDENAYSEKLLWLDNLTFFILEQKQVYKHVCILGDFNICPTDDDVWDPVAWKGRVTCTKPERDWFKNIIACGFKDTLKEHTDSSDFTWWNYRRNGYQRNHGLRIDFVLMTDDLASCVVRAEVLTQYREMEKPSDHAPVLVEIRK